MNPRAWVQTVWLPATAGAVAGLSGWLVGVVVPDTMLLGVLVGIAFLLPGLVGYPDTVSWPGPPDVTTAGGWYDVRRLATVLSQWGNRRDVFATRVRPRLRVLAQRRLARLGVRWDDPAARRLLGPDVHGLLDGPAAPPITASQSPVALTELVLGRLDELPDELTTNTGQRGSPDG